MDDKPDDKPPVEKPDSNRARAKRKGGNGIGQSQPQPKQAERARLRSEMLDMRIAGYSFDRIRDFLIEKRGFEAAKTDTKWVRKQLAVAMDEIVLPKAEIAKAMMVEQIDRCMPAHYNAAVRGDVGAVHALIALLDRKSRLMGLNEPDKTQAIGADGKPISVVPVLNISINSPAAKAALESPPNVAPNPPQLRLASKTS